MCGVVCVPHVIFCALSVVLVFEKELLDHGIVAYNSLQRQRDLLASS